MLLVQAILLSKVISDLPLSPTRFNDEWKHLKELELVDPYFGKPEAIVLVLGMEIFGQLVLHNRQFGHRGLPMTLKAHFRWVLSGAFNTEKQQGSKTCCLVTTAAGSGAGQGLHWDRTYMGRVTQLVTLLSEGDYSLEKPSSFWPVVCSRPD